LHLVGILFPHINDDARSKSHQNYTLFVIRIEQNTYTYTHTHTYVVYGTGQLLVLNYVAHIVASVLSSVDSTK